MPIAHETRVTRRSWSGLIAIASVVLPGLTGSACGLFPPEEYSIRADSITVTTSDAPGSVNVRVHGMEGANGCASLDRVERRERADALVRRFIGQRVRATCTPMPLVLDFSEPVAVPTGRVLRDVVEQPDGSSIARDLSSP
jgi:hypothetical protein